MHREVPFLYSRLRQLARSLQLLAGRLGRSLAILLSFLLAASVSASSVTYTYDEGGRLKLVTYDNGTSTTYTLDAAGNRKTVASTLDTTQPPAPTLTATAASLTQINLQWTLAADTSGSTIAGFHLFRDGSTVSLPGLPAAVAGQTVYSFSDTGLAANSLHSYTLTEFDNASPPNESVLSAAASATTGDYTPPTIPAGLAATAPASGTVNLTWTGSTDTGGSGLAGYIIYRFGAHIGTSATASYSDTSTLGTTSYTYTIKAYDNAGNASAQSSGVSITTPDTIPPSVPTGLTATVISASQVNLSWNASTDTGGSGMGGYAVYRNGKGLGGSTTTTYSDTTVGGSTTYTYTVLAYDNAVPIVNESPQSAAAIVTTPSNVPSVPGLPQPHGKVTTQSWTESWTASTGPVAYYVLSETGDTTATYTITAPTTSSAQRGGNGLSYSFQVQACNSSNQCSAFSGTTGVFLCVGGVCP